MLVMKYILKQKQMNEVFTGGIGSFALFLLIVSFLQHHEGIRKGTSLSSLLVDFCELYGCEFNYYSAGICVLEGGSYFDKERRGWFNGSQPHLLSIQDPCDPDNVCSTSLLTKIDPDMRLGRVKELLQYHDCQECAAQYFQDSLKAPGFANSA